MWHLRGCTSRHRRFIADTRVLPFIRAAYELRLAAYFCFHSAQYSQRKGGALSAAGRARRRLRHIIVRRSGRHDQDNHASHTKRRPGPLSGIPVAIKDIIATSDMPTTNGSAIYRDHIPAADAWVVERLRNLGATIFGKTVSTEFAWRHPGPTVNPWNPKHTPGGSSSGSAAAVAAGVVPLALGTQTLGSVIRPAAFNGVVGFKPSFGAIPRTGVHHL